jgi:hypothetical protein
MHLMFFFLVAVYWRQRLQDFAPTPVRDWKPLAMNFESIYPPALPVYQVMVVAAASTIRFESVCFLTGSE